MYELRETEYGVKFIFKGFMEKAELQRWTQEVGQVRKKLAKGFCVLHDMRGMYPLPPEARELMKRNMELAKQAGLGRSAQIVDDAIAAIQFKRLAKEVGISDTMRQIDASSVPDCERVAIDWIVKGIDPDKK
jgi:hypothetical protein